MSRNDRVPDFTIHRRCVIQGEETLVVRSNVATVCGPRISSEALSDESIYIQTIAICYADSYYINKYLEVLDGHGCKNIRKISQ
jgi:hypothetical protein